MTYVRSYPSTYDPWKEVIAAYDEPKLDEAKAEALADYVARRKAEGGAPMN